ncbi:hypothetical protein ES708_00033 [subsurface metagenome]
MAKTKLEREIEQKPQGHLIAMCDQRDLDHTGDREALIARLVEWENAQSEEPEPEPEPKAEPEPETSPEEE